LKGGAGNDINYLDSTCYSIVDTIGIDTVASSISWTVSSNLENLPPKGTDALTWNRNTSKNIIIGLVVNNVVDSFADKDMLTRGASADAFRFSTRPSFGASSADTSPTSSLLLETCCKSVRVSLVLHPIPQLSLQRSIVLLHF